MKRLYYEYQTLVITVTIHGWEKFYLMVSYDHYSKNRRSSIIHLGFSTRAA
jgi:hypothetical protein